MSEPEDEQPDVDEGETSDVDQEEDEASDDPLDRLKSAKARHDERRAAFAGRTFESETQPVPEDELDPSAYLDAVCWAIEDSLAGDVDERLAAELRDVETDWEQVYSGQAPTPDPGRPVVDVDALRELIDSGQEPTPEQVRDVVLLDEDEVAELMEPIRSQWAEGRSPEEVAALWAVTPADVLVELVRRAIDRL